MFSLTESVRIISGEQTGVDRAALDFIKLAVSDGVPKAEKPKMVPYLISIR